MRLQDRIKKMYTNLINIAFQGEIGKGVSDVYMVSKRLRTSNIVVVQYKKTSNFLRYYKW